MNTAPSPTTEFIPFRPAELKAFRRRKRLPGPQWAERNIYVPVGSRQGLYRNHNNPPLYGILEIAGRPHVRTVVLGKGIQTGGTLGFYILLLREADYSKGGDNALIVMADERSVKKLSKKRLQRMIDKSPTLAAIKSSNPDDTTIYSITLADGFTIDIGWASSEMSVSSESYRVVILDEISKYKVRGNIEDAKGRTTVYPDTKKVFIFSSPALDSDDPDKRDPLMEEAESCDVMMDYHVKCPDCGHEQVMIFDNIKWPRQESLLPGGEASDPKAIRRNKSAWYECPHCKSRWNDYKRDKAVLAAMRTGWKPSEEGVEFFQSVYFHYPAWLSPFMSISEVAARWLEAQGDEEKLQKWHNLVAGVSYKKQIAAERAEDHVLKYKSGLPRNAVPLHTARLALTVDTQHNSFYYTLWAYGFAPSLAMRMIRHGNVESFGDLEHILTEDYLDADGNVYRVGLGMIDSGGTKKKWEGHSRTIQVYDWCRKNRVMKPIKGVSSERGNLLTYRPVETYPGTNKRMVGGLVRTDIRVDYFKDELARRLEINPGDPGALLFHDEIDEVFAKHFHSEGRDELGRWVHDRKRGRNDYWDCSVYAMAVLEILKTRIKQMPSETAGKRTSHPEQIQEATTESEQRHNPSGRNRPSWYRR